MTEQLYAGVARADVTPPVGIAHANWGAQVHERAAGVDLPLWATALALRNGDQTVVFVDVDLGLLGEDTATNTIAAIQGLTGIPPENIRLGYTHTHSGPTTAGRLSGWTSAGAEMVDPYDNSLVPKLAGIAWEAFNKLEPARIAAGIGEAKISVNRRFQRPGDDVVVVGRNWDGPVDHDVPVIRIDKADGSPLAAVVVYACHPITVGPDNDQITPDYPGQVKRVVEASTGAVTLFFQGAAGDIGPIRGVAKGGAQVYKKLGSILGLEASKVFLETDTQPTNERYLGTLESGAPLAKYDDEPLPLPSSRIRVATRELKLPVRQLPPPDELEAQYQGHLARLNQLRAEGGSADEIRFETMSCKRTAMRSRLAADLQGITHRSITAQVIAIGDDIAMVAIPGEPFVKIGLGIRAGSPFKYTLFCGYANVGWSYIPTAEAYPLGGYEIEITPWDPSAAQQIVDEIVELLNEVAAS